MVSLLSPTSESTTAHGVLVEACDSVGPALRAAVDRLPDSMRLVAGYHFGRWDANGRAIGPSATSRTAGGKMIRPTLTMLAARAAGGGPGEAVPAAVAVELVHNFSLLHDDVMDKDETRRHRPTVWHVFGVGTAILAGDSLLTLALQVLADSGHPATVEGIRILAESVQELVDGQSADLAFERRTDVELPECLAMSSRKTGALLGSACALGALFGGGDGGQVAHLRAFGEHLGLAFQLADDLLGIWGDPTVTGKPRCSDLQNRKKSLVVVAALGSGTLAGEELAQLYHGDEALSESDLTLAADLVERAGGRAWSDSKADALLGQALRHLRLAGVTATYAEQLDAIAHFMVRRDR